MGEVLPGVRPDRLDVVDIRFPPQNTVWDDMYNEVTTHQRHSVRQCQSLVRQMHVARFWPFGGPVI